MMLWFHPPSMPTLTAIVRDFTWINPPEFYHSKMNDDPEEFIDEVYNVLVVMGVSSKEKAELVGYQLN